MITQISYNVLIERLRAFADGHFLIKGFTHGHPSNIDIEKDLQFPWMHVYPVEVEPRAGSRLYSFIITFADLPRDKETPAEYEREVISDCIKLAEDLIAEIQNGLTLFGPTVELEGSPSIEVFIQEYSQTLTGVNLALTLSVPWDWSACDIPADWSVGGSGSGGTGSGGTQIILETNGVLNGDQTLLNIQQGENVTITDNGSGTITINAVGGGGEGTVTSVALTAPLAFSVSGSPITGAGTLALSASGTSSQYIDGSGNLQAFPTIPAAQVPSDWAATTGVSRILNKPTIPAAQVNSDWNASSGVAEILNKPTIPTTLDSLTDVNAPSPTNGQVLTWNGTAWVNNTPATGGTVTSVALTMPAAFSVSGSPVTTAGTLAVTGAGTTSQYVRGDGTLATMPTGLPPTGAAGGDLMGTYPNPTVSHIHGIEMQAGTPTAGDVWLYEGAPAKWQHQKLPAVHVTNDSAVTGTTVKDALNHLNTTKVESNAVITGATATKITYDSKGLVTGGTTLAAADMPTGIDAANIGSGNVSNTEFGYLDGVSSAIQTQLNGKQATIGLTTVGTNLATLANPSAVRFLRINADNTVTARTAAEMVTDLGITSGSTSLLYQSQNATNVPASSIYFGCLFGGALSIVSADTLRRTPIATAGTISRLYVQTSSAQPATGSLVCTVRKNSVDQALTLTIAAGSAAGVFTDLVNSVSVVQGDLMGMKFQNNATTTSANVLSNQVLLAI